MRPPGHFHRIARARSVAVLCLIVSVWWMMPGSADPPPRSSGPAMGTLLAIGGGPPTPDIYAAAARLAGGAGARWVVIPTAEVDSAIDRLRRHNFVSVLGQNSIVLHTRDRREADSEEFVAPLRSATA